MSDISFGSARGALEFYYGFHATGYRGINYELVRVDKSHDLDTRQLDTFCTIGVYVKRLDTIKKFVLAYFFMRRLSDAATSQEMSRLLGKSYKAYNIKWHRSRAIRKLDDDFREIGLIV